MKAKFLVMLGLVALFCVSPVLANDTDKNDPEKEAKYSPEVQRIVDRVNELKAIDKSEMSREEKKELRAEIKELKEEANAASKNGGIFISTGAIIIILLLIIIL
ncbi:hypothetical protein [Peijinzhouia sedimentorum]|tara:strand:+ start:149 stop:460 length:312 start_codon:yes stop_codon:yes gene_type:complete